MPARPGSGRKKGSANVKTRAIADKAASEGLTPLEYMLEVLRNEGNELNTRLDAAKSAAPYIHPRLSAMQVAGDPNAPMKMVIEWAGRSKGSSSHTTSARSSPSITIEPSDGRQS